MSIPVHRIEDCHRFNTLPLCHVLLVPIALTNRTVEVATGTAGLVPCRLARCADSLVAGARSARRIIAAVLPLHRSRRRLHRYPPVIRLALAVGGHLSGGPCPFRRRNSTSAVRSGDYAHDPALLGVFSLVRLRAHDLAADTPLLPATAARYQKRRCTLSDAIAAARREILHHQVSFMSRANRDSLKIPRQLWDRAANALAYAA